MHQSRQLNGETKQSRCQSLQHFMIRQKAPTKRFLSIVDLKKILKKADIWRENVKYHSSFCRYRGPSAHFAACLSFTVGNITISDILENWVGGRNGKDNMRLGPGDSSLPNSDLGLLFLLGVTSKLSPCGYGLFSFFGLLELISLFLVESLPACLVDGDVSWSVCWHCSQVSWLSGELSGGWSGVILRANLPLTVYGECRESPPNLTCTKSWRLNIDWSEVLLFPILRAIYEQYSYHCLRKVEI